jgi:hypothetical protein
VFVLEYSIGLPQDTIDRGIGDVYIDHLFLLESVMANDLVVVFGNIELEILKEVICDKIFFRNKSKLFIVVQYLDSVEILTECVLFLEVVLDLLFYDKCGHGRGKG